MFHQWLSSQDNVLFWRKPMASEKLDQLISNQSIQESIAGNKKNHQKYAYIESQIVMDYALLIDFKLRQAFNSLVKQDFENPVGFERKEQANANQRQYIAVRDYFQFFVNHEMSQYPKGSDAQVNAFRRWVAISDLLLQRHCYEGFIIITSALQVLGTPYLIASLPKHLQENYTLHSELALFDGNHKTIRAYMLTHKSRKDFSPLLFTQHAITILIEAIAQLRCQQFALNAKKKMLLEEICKLSVLYYQTNEKKYHNAIAALIQARTRITNQIVDLSKIIHHHCEQRSVLVAGILKEQHIPFLNELPVYLEQTYTQIKNRYQHTKTNNNTLRKPTSSLAERSSDLYTKKLLPSFWQRRGQSADEFWATAFKLG